MAKAQLNKQDTLASERPDIPTGPAASDSSDTIRVPRELQDAAINAPVHRLVDLENRAKTEAIPAAAVPGDLPGPTGTIDIHASTQGFPYRDGEPETEGWYAGQGGVTGTRERDTTHRAKTHE